MKIANPIVELLAIKLYEHDHQGNWPPPPGQTSWMASCEEDREIYRAIARGDEDLPGIRAQMGPPDYDAKALAQW
jgi:hypothetical protein